MNKPKHSKLVVSLCVIIGVLEAPRKKTYHIWFPAANLILTILKIVHRWLQYPHIKYPKKKIKVWRTVNFNCVIIMSTLKMKLLWYNTIKNCNKSFIMSLLLYLMAKTIETFFVQSFLILNIRFQHFPEHTFKWLPVLLKLFFPSQPSSKEVSGMEGKKRREGGREGRNRKGQDREEKRQERKKGKKRKLSLLYI